MEAQCAQDSAVAGSERPSVLRETHRLQANRLLDGKGRQLQPQPQQDTRRPWRGTTRLELVPRWAVVRSSTLADAGLGLFAAQDLPAEFELGQYVGTIHRGTVFTSVGAYTWEITPQRPSVQGEMMWIDGEQHGSGLLHDTPNNLRYVNCANEDTDINTEMFQRGECVFYRTTREVKQGEELLMTYGPCYWAEEGKPTANPDLEPEPGLNYVQSFSTGSSNDTGGGSESEQSDRASEARAPWKTATTPTQLLATAASITEAHRIACCRLEADRSSAPSLLSRRRRNRPLTAPKNYPCHALVLCEAVVGATAVAEARESSAIAHSCRPNLRARVEKSGNDRGANTGSADSADRQSYHFELRAAREIAAEELLSVDRRPRAVLLGNSATQCGLQPCVHCNGLLDIQRQRQKLVVDGTRALVCPFCVPVSEREKGYVLPALMHHATAGEICPISDRRDCAPTPTEASFGNKEQQSECRWLCSEPGCPASRLAVGEGDTDGVSQHVVDVQLGANSIAPSYLSLETSCETLVRKMCACEDDTANQGVEAEAILWTPVGMRPQSLRQHMAEDGSGIILEDRFETGATRPELHASKMKIRRGSKRPVTVSSTSELDDAENRARAVARLIGHSHWTVAASTLLSLRADCSHGHVEEHFDRRLEWLWRWLTSTERSGLTPTIAMAQLLGTPWVLGVADGLRTAVSTPAWLCNEDISDILLTTLRTDHMHALDTDDFAVVDGPLLSKWELRAARLELEMLRQRGELATVGQPSEVRRDEVCWLLSSAGDDIEGNESSSSDEDIEQDGSQSGVGGHTRPRGGLNRALSVLRAAAALLQEHEPERALVVPRNCMAASYGPDGAHYIAHRDNQGNSRSDRRYFTVVLYLNDPDWDTDRDGGALRAYVGADSTDDEGHSARKIVDICPKGGLLVMFRSRVLLHEVLPAYKRRWALSIWIEEDSVEEDNKMPATSVLFQDNVVGSNNHRDHDDEYEATAETTVGENSARFEGNAKKLSAAVKWYGRVLQCTPPHSIEWLAAARGIRAVARLLGKFSPRQVVSERDSSSMDGAGEPGLVVDEKVIAWLEQEALLGHNCVADDRDGDSRRACQSSYAGGDSTGQALPGRQSATPRDSDRGGVQTTEDALAQETHRRTHVGTTTIPQGNSLWSRALDRARRALVLARPVQTVVVAVVQRAMVLLAFVSGLVVEMVRDDTKFGGLVLAVLFAISLRRRTGLLTRVLRARQ